MQNKRPSWDDYFLSLLPKIASRSLCLRRQIGSVLVRDKTIISTGFNSPGKGLSPCSVCMREEKGIPSGQQQQDCRASHSEANAIVLAAYNGISTKNSTLYVSTFPCSICARLIINAGIIRIVYTDEYTDPFAKELLEEAKIKMEKRDV